MRIEYYDKQLIIDGQPRVLLFAEFHYYRSPKHVWREKLELIKESGAHGIATYIPWLIHEQTQGDFDFTGKYRGEHDLASFIELVEEFEFFFIARPGPFIMAEMKNDGIPFWVAKTYPEVVPESWNGKKATTVTLDYLAPNFLKATYDYYAEVIPLIAKHQYPNGTTIGLQLDNEIGMLSWVSNNPDLTKTVLKDFYSYLTKKYGEKLQSRYRFAKEMNETFMNHVRSPKKDYYHQLHQDLGTYMRVRYSTYVDTLSEYALKFGFDKGLFIVNIHGCSGGRSHRYPIGISQLYESYRGKQNVISGSDHYLKAVDVPQFTDAYMLNELTRASNDEHQPLSSMEFSAGNGDYGNSYGNRYLTSRLDFMTRIFIAQENRLLNYYSFVGGQNYRFNEDLHDGNDRIAITGEEHGFAAPISPDGSKNYTWDRMVYTMRLMRQHENFLADQKLVTDNLEYVFDPDYFMTEYHAPDFPKEVYQNLEMHRAGDMWDTVIKSILLQNYHFHATNIKTNSFTKGNVLLVPSARYMSKESQQKIVDFLADNGKMLLYGEVPEYDLETNPCTILMDYLKLYNPEPFTSPSWKFRPSIIAKNLASGPAELHRQYYQSLEYDDPDSIIFEVYHNQKACGFHIKQNNTEAIVITTRYNANLELFDRFMKQLGVTRHIYHDYTAHQGIFMLKTAGEKDTSYIHVINLDDFDKEFILHNNDISLPIYLESKQALLLPFHLKISEDVTVISSTNEIIRFDKTSLTVSLMGPTFALLVNTNKTPTCDSKFVTINKGDSFYTVTKEQRLYTEDECTIDFN